MVVAFSQKLEEQDRKALNTKEQLQREHRYLKRRLEQLSVSGSVERIRTDSMGSTISTDSEQGSLSTVSCFSGWAACNPAIISAALIKKELACLPVVLACPQQVLRDRAFSSSERVCSITTTNPWPLQP